MSLSRPTLRLVVFPSALGWMALIGSDQAVRQLTFGHKSSRAAVAGLDPRLVQAARKARWEPAIVARLRAYASGTADDFRDVPVDPGQQTPFQRRVLDTCRRIPLGATLTYGQLAAKAGAPAAARAVGRCMATNPIPLVIPCHRVVGSDGRLRGYSGVGGTAMKRCLLDLEAAMLG